MDRIIKKHEAFTSLALRLNALLDKGETLSIRDVFNMCENGSIVTWLDEHSLIPEWDDDCKAIMNAEFFSLANCVTADEFGIEHNGIGFLLAMSLCFANNLPTRDLEDL